MNRYRAALLVVWAVAILAGMLIGGIIALDIPDTIGKLMAGVNLW
jgi:hypothetical protein